MARILIVDDDHTTANLLKMMFELDGFEVVLVLRADDVLRSVEQQHPDLILMDYHLANVPAIEVLKQLRQLPHLRQTPIVVGSGMNVEAEVLQAGATHFLIKPYDPAHLSQMMRQMIGSR